MPLLDLDPARRESVGRLLARTRQEYGQDLKSVAEALRIRYVYLEAIESGRFDRLPGPAYAVGFVRSYAEFLGLERETVVEAFKQEVDGIDRQTQLNFLTPVPEGKIPGGAVFLVCALVAGLAYGGWYYLSTQGRNVVDLIPEVPLNLQALMGNEDPAVETSRVDSAAMNAILADAATRPDSEPAVLPQARSQSSSPSEPLPTSAAAISQTASADQTPTMEQTPATQGAPAVPLDATVANGLAETERDASVEVPSLIVRDTVVAPQAAPSADNVVLQPTEQAPGLARLAEAIDDSLAASSIPPGLASTADTDQGEITVIDTRTSTRARTGSQAGLPDSAAVEPETHVISGSTAPFATDVGAAQNLDAMAASRNGVPVDGEPADSVPVDGVARTQAGNEQSAPLSGDDETSSAATGVTGQPEFETSLSEVRGAAAEVSPQEEGLIQADGQQELTQVLETVAAIPAVPSGNDETAAYSDERAPINYGETNQTARVVLRAAQDCWVQVRDPNGALLLTRVLRKGDSYRVPNQRNLTLLTGNAGGLWIEVDGIRLAPLGPVGAVRRDVSLDPERLLSGTALNQ